MSDFFLTGNGIIQIIFFLVVVLALVKPFGTYMARVYSNQFILLEHLVGPLEDLFYKFAKINPNNEMTWQQYAFAVVLFSGFSFILLFFILKLQAYLPFNPQHFPNVSSDLAFNITASFITNTNWQAYSGESTLSYFSQMCGLTVQNFLSAGTGMAVLMALVRGLTRKKTAYIGNFWVDMVRGCLYILLPLSIILSVTLGSQGVIQNFKPYVSAKLIEPTTDSKKQSIKTQGIPGGPVASQVAIKQLGTNGGGFFNTNSAHPFENPTPLSNLLEMLAILLIPTSLCYTFGVLINDRRQGWMILATMSLLFIPLMLFCVYQEQSGYIAYTDIGVDQKMSEFQSGGNMLGKEVRFGIVNSTLWTSATTAASNGSVNSMLDAYTPLGGVVPLLFILTGEIIYGGVGSGLYGMLLYILITVFIAGLMVGRTPEYLGNKIQSFEMKMAAIAIFVPILFILFGTAVAVMCKSGLAGLFNPGAQGFIEILYAFASSANNNGSAFAGINANTPFYNTWLALAMLFGRFWIIIPVLAIAGSLAQKQISPNTIGTLETHTPLFVMLLMGVILLIGLLTYIPVLTLGPITEYFRWIQ